MNPKSLFTAYLRQQRDCAMPDIMVSPEFGLRRFIGALTMSRVAARPLPGAAARPAQFSAYRQVPAAQPPAPAGASVKTGDPYARLSRLKPITPAIPARASVGKTGGFSAPGAPKQPLSYEEKRAVFIKLYGAKCAKCALGRCRKKFVFGAGNVDARLMIIGLTPGADEDEAGMPLVGDALDFLTSLLEAASIDHKKEVFITNVLKCRPPNDRAPEGAEIAACLPLLQKQIEVVAPAVLLILGSVAARALIGATGDIPALEGKTPDYRGIPAVAANHPAALMADPELRTRFESAVQRVVKILKESNRNGAL